MVLVSAGGQCDFEPVLAKCGLERMLFRLSKSKYRDTFILKGALL
jgi:hypothetical protein